MADRPNMADTITASERPFFQLVELYVKIFKTVGNRRETLSRTQILAYRAAKLTCP